MIPLVFLVALSPELIAVGVVVSPSPERSVAILRDGGRTRVVRVGESAFGGRLVAVSASTVTLEFGAERVELRLPASAAPAPPAPTPRVFAGTDAPPEDPATPYRTMERRDVERRLGAEIPRILADTAVAPVLEEGRVVGLALTRIAEPSLLLDAGLRVGDVLVRINDVEIDGMATLIGLWPRLQGASELRAVVLRNGQPVSLAVSLR